MENLTQMERSAIQESRRAFAEALVACGHVEIQTPACALKVNVIDVFAQLDETHVDMVIERTWDALRASMMRQSAQGDVPFPLPTSPAGSISIASPPVSGPPPQGTGDVPPGYFINAAGDLLKKGLQDDDIPF